MSAHREGWPVSYGSYVRGCRCGGCREKQRAYREANRAEIAEKNRAYYEARRAEQPIEQAIARGWTTSRIMAELGVTYEQIATVRARLDDDEAAS